MKTLDLLNRPLVIHSNYGDESIALVQWAFEQGLNATVVSIDTGWAAEAWQQRVQRGQRHAEDCGFQVERLISKITFSEAVLGRCAFPSSQFQWCTGLLKGLPFLDWLEAIDGAGDVIVLLAKRKTAALAHLTLKEWVEVCEYHGDRTVWHPLFDLPDDERDALLERAKFTPLGHRSLECEPCINSTAKDMARLSIKDSQKLRSLEKEIGASWGTPPKAPQKYLDLFYRSCGNHFGCGL